MRRYRRDDRTSIATSAGTVEYRDIGSGAPVVFLHGALLNSALWDDVAFYLPTNLRLIRLDLPLGGHRFPVAANADLGPAALAVLLLDIVEALDLRQVILVASDSGVAICRLAASGRDPRMQRIAGLLFTNCDAFGEHSGHPIFGAAPDEAGMMSALSSRRGRKFFFERLTREPRLDEELCDLLGGFMESADVRRDAFRALAGLATAIPPHPETFDGPVKVLWGIEDECCPLDVGARLAAGFESGELLRIRHSRMLVPLDQPESIANAIIDMIEHGSRPTPSAYRADAGNDH